MSRTLKGYLIATSIAVGVYFLSLLVMEETFSSEDLLFWAAIGIFNGFIFSFASHDNAKHSQEKKKTRTSENQKSERAGK